MRFCGFKRYLNEKKPALKLCLESFCSSNLTHFHLEQRKSNWNGTVHERNRENQTRTEQYMNETERAKNSILPMPCRG